MNWNFIFAQAKALLPLGGKYAQDFSQRALTIPKKDIEKLMAGASKEDIAEAIRLRDISADANSDFVVFVASKGAVDAD